MPSKKLKAPPKTVSGLMDIMRRDVLWTNYLTAQVLAKPNPFTALLGQTVRAVRDTIPKPPSWWKQPELFAMWKARYGHRI